MAGKTEQRAGVFAGSRCTALREPVALADKAGACAMLEPTVALADDEHLEEVVVDGRAAVRHAAEQVDLCLGYALQIVGKTAEIATMPAGDSDVGPCAARLKMDQIEVSRS